MNTNIKGEISGRHNWDDGFCGGSVEFCTNGPGVV
jgi:hypothetical protein